MFIVGSVIALTESIWSCPGAHIEEKSLIHDTKL